MSQASPDITVIEGALPAGWRLAINEKSAETVLALVGPGGQAAAFIVGAGSVRSTVLLQLAADQAKESNHG